MISRFSDAGYARSPCRIGSGPLLAYNDHLQTFEIVLTESDRHRRILSTGICAKDQATVLPHTTAVDRLDGRVTRPSPADLRSLIDGLEPTHGLVLQLGSMELGKSTKLGSKVDWNGDFARALYPLLLVVQGLGIAGVWIVDFGKAKINAIRGLRHRTTSRVGEVGQVDVTDQIMNDPRHLVN